MQWRLQAVCGSEALAARGSFVEFLQDLGMRRSECHCAEMVFGELVGNAVRHAPGPIDISAHRETHGPVVLEICDTGPYFKLSCRPPQPESESGRGLYIVSLLATDVWSENTGCGNRVTAILHMTDPDELSPEEATS
jgi:anti-sigma regulatory factor (Ser/Thr protein kinase)